MNKTDQQMSTVDELEKSAASGENACACDGDGSDCAPGCACCGMSGRGGKLRIGLLIALAVVIVVLLVQGFATAG